MHLAHLRLRNFRNYPRLDVDFDPGFHLLLGDNAQGKTNVLESIYLLSTLRSFRGVGGAQMIRDGEEGFFAGAEAVGLGTKKIQYYWSPKLKKLTVNSEPVRRIADFLGALRTVVFCTEDLQLVKGTARIRRRFVDLLLTQTHDSYLALLQSYARTVRSRNMLLKREPMDAAAVEAFSAELIKLGNRIIQHRKELVPKISPLARLAYRRISRDAEDLKIEYQPSVREDFEIELRNAFARERRYRVTLVGPHRDEFRLTLDQKPAETHASEGQKRSLVIALKMAQAEYLTGIHGSPPILLIDDVMGELDVHRRSGFLPLLTRARQMRGQAFMTCTEQNWPEELDKDLRRWKIQGGQIQPLT